MTQVLVLLRATAEIRARDLSVEEPVRGRGVQLFGDRVLIARLSQAEREIVSDIPGVIGVFTGAVPEEVDVSDDPLAAIAVRAWNVRRRQEAGGGKRRIGDGAAWDSPPAALDDE